MRSLIHVLVWCGLIAGIYFVIHLVPRADEEEQVLEPHLSWRMYERECTICPADPQHAPVPIRRDAVRADQAGSALVARSTSATPGQKTARSD